MALLLCCQNYCVGEEICTAECKCFDGRKMRPEDTDPFLFNDADQQGMFI